MSNLAPHPLSVPAVRILVSLRCCRKRTTGSCRGKYNTAIYTQLDNICEDCYNLYKDPDVHHMCR